MVTVYVAALPEQASPAPLIVTDGNGLIVTGKVATDVHPAALVPETITTPLVDPHFTVTVVAVVAVIVPWVTVKVFVAPPVAVYV